MAGNEKKKALLFLIVVTLAAIVLASSLPALELKPGMPLPEIKNDQVAVVASSGVHAESISINRFIIILSCLIAAGFFLYSMYRVMRGTTWKDILALLQPLLFIVLLLAAMMMVIMSMPRTSAPPSTEAPVPTLEPPVTAPLGPVPPLLLWIVGACVILLVILIAVWIYRNFSGKPDASDLIAQEAEKARQKILLGVGLKDVIIECYRQMSLVLQEDRGITRKDFMTTLEFEETLSNAGFPSTPVHDLTKMFNAARYSNWQPSSGDEQSAIQCFEAITRFTRISGEGD
jgi:hypothetical protein